MVASDNIRGRQGATLHGNGDWREGKGKFPTMITGAPLTENSWLWASRREDNWLTEPEVWEWVFTEFILLCE